jgi:hypothetical protein
MNEDKLISEKDIIKFRQIYEEECPLCKITTKVITQTDNYPEYHTEIYVQCNCGNYIEFSLPVN